MLNPPADWRERHPNMPKGDQSLLCLDSSCQLRLRCPLICIVITKLQITGSKWIEGWQIPTHVLTSMYFLLLSVKGSQFSVCYVKNTRQQSNWKSAHSDIFIKYKLSKLIKTAKKIIVQAQVQSFCTLDRIFYKVVIPDIYRCCCSCEPKNGLLAPSGALIAILTY